MNRILIALPMLAFAACGGGSEPVAEHGLELTQYTDKAIEGAFHDGVTTVALSSQEVEANLVVTRVTVADIVYKLTVDYNTGVLEFVGPARAANREQVTALRALEGELGFIASEGKTLTNAENTLRAAATMLSEAAAGEVLPTHTNQIARSVQNIQCGNYCRTLYGDASHGSCAPYKMTGVNSSNCKGRCGAGCDTARTGGSHKWTQDCAEHDYMIAPWTDCSDDVLSGANVSCGNSPGCFFASGCSNLDGCDNTPGANNGSCI